MEKEAALLESGKENKDLCSFYEDELTELYSSCGSDTCGDLCVAMQSRYLEILDFTQFFDHFVFTPNAENVLEKELKKEIPVK